jgi:hypothetical protein
MDACRIFSSQIRTFLWRNYTNQLATALLLHDVVFNTAAVEARFIHPDHRRAASNMLATLLPFILEFYTVTGCNTVQWNCVHVRLEDDFCGTMIDGLHFPYSKCHII